MKLEHADVLFMHSTPRPNSESSICCLGERNFGESPVPIINRSIGSFKTNGNIYIAIAPNNYYIIQLNHV